MQLTDLVETSRQLSRTRSRTAKVERLSDLLRRAEREQVATVASYLVGTLPQGRIGLGPAVVRAARPSDGADQACLDVADVDRRFADLAEVRGAGSTARRRQALHDLLRLATADEQAFLVRLVLGGLRQGALDGLMTEAIARAAGLPLADVRRALMLSADLPAVAREALTAGAAGLAGFAFTPFRPLQPMLAQPVEDLRAALERLGEAAVETKLDGARVQVHKVGRDVRVFSRQGGDVTAAVPEIVETIGSVPVRELVLDGEVLALAPDGHPRAFQDTMRRFGRRRHVERLRADLPLTPFFFDLIYVDGDLLVDRPTAERFRALDDATPGLVVPRRRVTTVPEAQAFLDRALEQGHEGVMAKALDAGYQAGGRGFSWLKVKPVHTLDLVVLAAEWGSGRRQGWLSNLHLGARDPDTGGFAMLGKTFKGMTDEMLTWQTERLQAVEVRREPFVVHVRPELVVEVAFSDVQRSPQYPAGLALRFARVKRYRPDKTPAEADTVEQVRRILERGHRTDPAAE